MLFQLDLNFIPPNFLVKDTSRSDAKRHLVFATKEQLQLLAKAKRWYVDGTYKIVKKPFEMLYSVHAFIRVDDNMKQVPLAFMLMSGRTERDYKKVHNALISFLM